MNEDHVTAWVLIQQKVWHGDTSSKAAFVTIKKRGSDDVIFRFPIDAENLPDMLKQCLRMQAEELPKGSHGFVLIATDESGQQLSELPQTVKGTNGDATSAAQEQLAMANAHAKALANLDNVNQILERNATMLAEKLSLAIEDKFAVLDNNVELRGINHKDQLEHEKFIREMARRDKLVDAFATQFMPILGLIVNQKVQKWLKDNPDIMSKMLGEDSDATSPATKESPDPASPSVAESRQEPVPPNSKGRGKGNHRPVTAQRR